VGAAETDSHVLKEYRVSAGMQTGSREATHRAYRGYTSCGDLRANNAGERATVRGWVNRRRDHGGLIFIDLRDRYGITQCTINPASAPEAHAVAGEARAEYVLEVTGEVVRRPAGAENPHIATGEVELLVDGVKILNASKTPPFVIAEGAEHGDVDESLRLTYRYLDLRRRAMTERMILRHTVIKFMRDWLSARGFLEIETPMLIKATPEGARDFLVPSRLYPGEFYALPQSPQQLKQILMIAGLTVTNMRGVHKAGSIKRRTFEMSLDKVESVDVNQSILGRILNYGSVTVRGVGEGAETIDTIASPLDFRNHITAR